MSSKAYRNAPCHQRYLALLCLQNTEIVPLFNLALHLRDSCKMGGESGQYDLLLRQLVDTLLICTRQWNRLTIHLPPSLVGQPTPSWKSTRQVHVYTAVHSPRDLKVGWTHLVVKLNWTSFPPGTTVPTQHLCMRGALLLYMVRGENNSDVMDHRNDIDLRNHHRAGFGKCAKVIRQIAEVIWNLKLWKEFESRKNSFHPTFRPHEMKIPSPHSAA